MRRVRFFVIACSSGIGPRNGYRSSSTTFASVQNLPTSSLFFPVLNFVNINTPGIPGCGTNGDEVCKNEKAKDLREAIAQVVSDATDLSVEIDNESIDAIKDEFRVKSKVFEITVPAKNLFGFLPAGTYSPAVDDGFYVMLKPLSVGAHSIRMRGSFPNGFSMDVTYELTVVPTSLK